MLSLFRSVLSDEPQSLQTVSQRSELILPTQIETGKAMSPFLFLASNPGEIVTSLVSVSKLGS